MVLTLLKTTTQSYILNKYVIIILMYVLLPNTCIKRLCSKSWTNMQSFFGGFRGLTGNISIVPGGPGKPSAPGRPARPGGP